MSNYPQGAQYDSSAPWNQPTRRTEWQAWYVFIEGTDEKNHTLQHEVHFPWWCELYDATSLARSYCKDHNLIFVDIKSKKDKNYKIIETECYYE
jgi:hypothetical protein